MKNLWLIFISSILVTFSGALMPGPLLSTTISESSRRGWKVGPLFILGHAILEVILLIGLFIGLAPLLTGKTSFTVIAFTGSAFMLWMAFGMFRSLPGLSFNGKPLKTNNSLPLTGALMSLANPYWTIWWATIGLGYVLNAQKFGFPGVAVFFTGHILVDFLWYTFVSVGIHKGRKILPLFVYRMLIGSCGLFLIVYAGYLISNGIKTMAL